MIVQPDVTTEKFIDKDSIKKLKEYFKKNELEIKKMFPEKNKKKDYRTGR